MEKKGEGGTYSVHQELSVQKSKYPQKPEICALTHLYPFATSWFQQSFIVQVAYARVLKFTHSAEVNLLILCISYRPSLW